MIRKMLTAAAVALGLLALLPGPLAAAQTSTQVTPPQLYALKAENPYVHTDVGGRRWIYGAASTNSTAPRTTRAYITQFYNGQWNVVGTFGENASNNYTQRAIGRVLCTGNATPYWFRTVGQVSYNGRWYPVFSAPVSQRC